MCTAIYIMSKSNHKKGITEQYVIFSALQRRNKGKNIYAHIPGKRFINIRYSGERPYQKKGPVASLLRSLKQIREL